MKVKTESEVAQLCPTLRNPLDCSLSGSSVHGIFQARVLEWGAITISVKYTKLYILKEYNSISFDIIHKTMKGPVGECMDVSLNSSSMDTGISVPLR